MIGREPRSRLPGSGPTPGMVETHHRSGLPGGNACSRSRPSSREAKGAAGRADHDQRARPGSGRGAGEGAGLRGLPHRPALPRGRDQRRLPVPARPRGRRASSRRSGRTSRPSRRATSWSSTGARSAASCRACNRGEPWYCFDTHNATQKMTLPRETAPSCRRRWASARSPRRPWSPPASAPRSTRRPAPAAVGLLGCGVMAGIGAAINTGSVTRGKSVAVIGCGGVGVAAIAGSALAGASPIIAVDIDAKKLEAAKRMGATHTVDSLGHRPGRGDPGADRRLRRRRRDRRGRPPGDLEAGVLRPRPGRHRRPGRRTDPGHEDPRHPADRRLRPRRRAEVQLVRRLPARPRLPDAGRPLPAGPARPGRVRHRGDRLGDVEAAFDKMHDGDVLRSVVVL